MLPTNTLRIGWIGCGRHAAAMLLPQLRRLPVQIVAVCDSDAPRLAAAAARFGVASTYGDYRQLLEHPGLDAVGIAVGPAQHAAMAVAALQRGLAVFVEKPPGGSAAAARQIQAAAQAHRRPVVVGFMKRFACGYRIARNLLQRPEFGARLGYTAHYLTAPTYFVGDADYSGFFLHHCVHALDLLRYLVGEPVALRTRKHETAPGKLLLHVDIDFSGGALGTLIMGTVQARSTPMEFVQIMGDQRRVEIDNIVNVRYYRAPSFKAGDPAATLADESDTLCWQPNLTVAADEDFKGYHALLCQFVDCAATGRCNADTPTIDDGVAAMALLDALISSFDSGARFELQ